MENISVKFSQTSTSIGVVGRVGEHLTRSIIFDCKDVLADYPDANITCAIQRPADKTPYRVHLTHVSTGVYVCVLSQFEVAQSGFARFELRAEKDGETLKSAVFFGKVENSLNKEDVDDINIAYEATQKLYAAFDEVKQETSTAISGMEKKTQSAIDEVKQETSTAINGIKQETTTAITNMKQETATAIDEVKQFSYGLKISEGMLCVVYNSGGEIENE